MPEGQPFSFSLAESRNPFKQMEEKNTAANCCNTWTTALSPSGPPYLHLDQWLHAPAPGHWMASQMFLDYHSWEGRGHATTISWEEGGEAFK